MNTNCDLTILYGSQTGNSEDVANRIARDAKKRHKLVHIYALDDYDVNNLPNENYTVFVVSTTGCGDPPDNMKNFWKFIWLKALASDSLSKLKYEVVGLGDSSYQKFNIIAKKLHKRLSHLGGTSVMPCCLGDDQHEMGYNAVVNPWLNEFWDVYLEENPIPDGLQILPQNCLLPPKFTIQYIKDDLQANVESSPTKSKVRTFHAPVLSNKRVTADDHWQDVRLIKFDISGSDIRYRPGDVCNVRPKNARESVSKFGELFNFSLNQSFILDCADMSSSMTSSSVIKPGRAYSLRFLLENYFDICGSPKEYFWEVLAAISNGDVENAIVNNGAITQDENDLIMEREKLSEFLTPEGQDELFSYCYRPRRTILEVLSDFPQTRSRLTLPRLMDIIHPMKPRSFSIASSQSTNPNELELLVAVVSYKTRLVEPRRGLCSNYLANLIAGEDAATIWVDRGTLRFPDGDKPVIMVGPGTGCAPFRAFINHRSALNFGGNYLFFGCRNSDKDFFFRDEWKEKEEQRLLRVFSAFSRDQEEKIYVQHVIAKQESLVCHLILNQNAYFMIAGNSKNMPDSVRDALVKSLMEHGCLDQQTSESYLLEMEKKGRYQMETWS